MKLLSLFSALCLLTTTVTGNGLDNFLQLKLAEYPKWLTENDLDPSEVVTGPTKLQASNKFVNLECTLSNHGIKGPFQNIFVNSTSADLKNGVMTVSFTTQGNLTFSGVYMATGQLHSGVPIKSDGSWYIQVPEISVVDLNINWGILSSNGHLTILSHTFGGVNLHPRNDDFEVYFENLWEGKNEGNVSTYKPVVQEAIYLGFQEYLTKSSGSEHPLRKSILNYFQKIFEETPLSEIISATMPPPLITTTTTEEEAPSTSTKAPDSTLSPSDDKEEEEGWKMSTTMAIMLALWAATIILTGVIIFFIVRLLVRQRHAFQQSRMNSIALPAVNNNNEKPIV